MTDQEIIDFASDFRDGLLDGRPSAMMCAMVCWPLATLLGINGVECVTRESIVDLGDHDLNHIWLELTDGRVLDPTADQFEGYPPVYLGDKAAIHQRIVE